MAAGDKKTVVMKVCGKVPDAEGNVSPTAADVRAAPGGFGLGERGKQLTSADDVNNIWKCGWYKFVSGNVPQNAIILSYLNLLRVESAANSAFMQTIYGMADNASYQITPSAQRCIYGSKITPWEYINPPMILGVEYRTTERYKGKPVYAQLVPFGPLPNNTLAATAHGIANFGDCIEFTINTVNGKGGPMNGDLNVVGCWANETQMNIKTTEDYSSSTANVLLRYTKTTD